jgi:hypothetical protein
LGFALKEFFDADLAAEEDSDEGISCAEGSTAAARQASAPERMHLK